MALLAVIGKFCFEVDGFVRFGFWIWGPVDASTALDGRIGVAVIVGFTVH